MSHNIVDVPVLIWLSNDELGGCVALKLSVQIPVSGSTGNAVQIAFIAFFSWLSTVVTGLRTASQLRLMGPVVHSRTMAKGYTVSTVRFSYVTGQGSTGFTIMS